MLVEFVNRILQLGPPNLQKFGDLQYSDRKLELIAPPMLSTIRLSTLQGMVDVIAAQLEGRGFDSIIVHVSGPTTVELLDREADELKRRQLIATAAYPEGIKSFPFGTWLNPENFIISAQQSFQRVKIQQDDGSYAQDLDYVLGIASKITAEATTDHEDDGIAQRVALKQGVVLKTEAALRPIVNLAPYRTFAEIDQVVSRFVFRARIQDSAIHLALFEGDGGRWRIDAAAAIGAWLRSRISEDIPVVL